MSVGDELRSQVDLSLSHVDNTVNALQPIELFIDELVSELVIMGISNNVSVSGVLGLSQQARTQYNEFLTTMFELRARLNDYKTGLI